ncbi:hypothetical protein FVEG_14839 [Fusarium verticillioides 7600]|uniref:Uncharacterized protein n=1 Tax=Gibberella moniliformis (strain M3125 / FGSC 7600) TaxID=334819 RepID=W7LRH5_GIBM7|nr:hypothetical protein FVEG_14839 [Fusarium verticillioides 7600]EWG38109.1 hypothetical protein FVEG_14839 [Fusarium verticillioides 7600]
MMNEPAPSFFPICNNTERGRKTLLETFGLSSRYTNVTRPTRVKSSLPEPLRSVILTTTRRFEIFCDNDGGLRAGARGQGEGRRMGKCPAHDRAQKKKFEGGESIACSNSR